MSIYQITDPATGKKSKTWYYQFQHDGRRFHGTTETDNKAKAKEFEKLIREQVKSRPDDTTINGGFAMFWEEVGQHYSGHGTVFTRMASLLEYLTDILKRDRRPPDLSSIQTKHLSRYVAQRRKHFTRHGKPLSNAAVNREIQLLRTIMRHARDVWDKKLDLPAFGKVLLPEADEHVVEVSHEFQAKIHDTIRDDYADILDFMIMCGARASNVMVGRGKSPMMKPQDIDLDRRELVLHVKSKKVGGRRIVLPITDPMAEILERNLGNHPDAVFTYECVRTRKELGLVRGNRYPITYTGFRKIFKKCVASLGRPNLRVHDLRHTAATRTLRSTGDLRMAQKQLGHTRISTTERYAHVQMEDLRVAMESAHKPPKIPQETPLTGFKLLASKKNSAQDSRS